MPADRLDVVVASRTLVPASHPPPGFPAVLQVSNLDLIFGSFHVYFIAVYPAPTTGFPAVAAAVRAALPAFLSTFFPFAGRVVTDASTGVPEIACTNAGAELVLADAFAAALAELPFADAARSLGAIPVPFAHDLALSLQLVRFACGGFALSWGCNHLLVDGHGATAMCNAWAELLRTGGISWEPHHERASLFRPRSPPRFDALLLDAEFTRYEPGELPNALLTATLVRRNYVVSAADVARLRAAASTPTRRATRIEALDTLSRYLGNVVTYASREAEVEAVSSATLAEVAAMAGAAIAEVFRSERFEDWMEARKGVFREEGGGKWTETVGTGTGSPALLLSAFVSFRVEGDFGFGRPRLMVPWLRPGRNGSAAMVVTRSPGEDGAWVVTARLWPRLADAVEADPEAVLKPATAARLGFGARVLPGSVVQQQDTSPTPA
ncbi:unnamed protein product [Urochloa decumbens]|uniref:Uncharacterized protein n=1 Tax=Urochloa decumbens TaxID=240449 RepID=A0ABC9DT28_9POAL